MVLTMRTKLVEIASTLKLIQSMIILAELLLKVSKILKDGRAVTDVALSHTFLLSGILFSLCVPDRTFIFHCHIFEKRMQICIAGINMHTNLCSCVGKLTQCLSDFLIRQLFNFLFL